MRVIEGMIDTALALVLTGGGARAADQVGVLYGIADRAPALELPILTDVSAGTINAATLAAHQGPCTVAVEALCAASTTLPTLFLVVRVGLEADVERWEPA